MAVIDVVTYNGEKDLLDLRLNILNKHVDQFIIVESPTTFSGREKPLYFGKHMRHFKKFLPKIKHYVNDERYTEEENKLAEESPNTQGAHHWAHEFRQKERIKDAIKHLRANDLVFIGDVDEIWQPGMEKGGHIKPTKLHLKVYTYYLNLRSSEDFHGTLVARYRDIKNATLNHLRSDSPGLMPETGWHFTSMGGYDEVKRKLANSYTTESYWTPAVQEKLQWNILNKKDFLGRDFTYEIDDSEWPKYLKDNVDKYKNLCYNEV